MADFEEERLLPCLVDILTISPNLTYADAVQRAKTMLSGEDGGGSGGATTCAHHVPVAACNDDDDETTQTMRLALKDAADDLVLRWTNIIRDTNSATSPHMEVVHTVDFIEGTQSSISVRAAVLAGMAVGDALGFLARGIVPLWEACTHRTLDDCLVLAYVEVFTAVLRLLGGYVDANHVWATAAESLLPSSCVEHLLCGLEVELAYHFKAGRATSKVSAPQHFFTFFLDVLDRLENGLRSEATVVQRLCFGRLGSTATAVFVEAYLWYDTSALLHNTDFVVFTINAFVDLLKSCNGRPHIHALEPLETVVAMPSAFDLYLRHGLREVASLLHSEASSSWRFQLLNENEKTLLQHPFYSMTRRFLRSLQAMLRRLFISAATMIERRGLDEAVRKTLLKPALDAYFRAAEIHEEQLMRSSNDLWFLVHALHAQLASVYAARRLMDDCVLSQRNVEQLDCPATRVRVDPYVAKLEKRLDVLLRRILSRLMQSVEEEDEESHSAGVGEWMRLEELLMSLQPKSSAAGRCLQQKLQDLIIHAIHPDTVNSMSLRGFLRAMDCPCSAELLGNLCAA